MLSPQPNQRSHVSTTLWLGYLVFCLCQQGAAALSISPKYHYFTKTTMLPPLEPSSVPLQPSFLMMDDDSNNSTCLSSTMWPYQEPSLGRLSIPVTYTNDPFSVVRWCRRNIQIPTEHTSSYGAIIGFDVEMYQTPDGRVPATVQLATVDSCLVVHLKHRNGRPSNACASILQSILCDERIVKAGCAIDEDMMALHNLWDDGLDAKSRLDLCGVGMCDKQRRGLKRLTEHILGVTLSSCDGAQRSNWRKMPLTKDQLVYSARDAWAGAAIAQTLADSDHDTFGYEALLETLQDQKSIFTIAKRWNKRRFAKTQLNKLLEGLPKHRRSHKNLPREIQGRVRRYRQLVRENHPVFHDPLAFKVDHLGIHLDTKYHE